MIWNGIGMVKKTQKKTQVQTMPPNMEYIFKTEKKEDHGILGQ